MDADGRVGGMCGNRVEELESRVNELEASVEGLTDELVECKVRLRELENAVDDDIGFETDIGPRSAEGTGDRSNTEDAEGETREDEEADSDFIVA
jgi:predicted RNase H-like nuclease (RuvC/YqgF family)